MSSANHLRFMTLLLALAGIAQTAYGQQVLSAQSGTIHYTEGKVTVDGRELHARKSQFATLRPGEELRTERGRVELLLTPGAFLRITDDSAVRMIDNRLSDTRVEVLEGSVLAECDALLKDNAITLLYAGNTIRLVKHGLYRIDTAPAHLRVFDGAAIVDSSSGQLTLKRGKETALDGGLVAEKFNRKNQDAFDQWDQSRSEVLAYASANASQSMLNANTPWTASGWYFNPSYDLFTFVPFGEPVYSPFGWQFWSPSAMAYYYVPVRGSNSGVSTAPNTTSSASTGNGGAAAGGGVRSFSGGSPTSGPHGGPHTGGFGGHR